MTLEQDLAEEADKKGLQGTEKKQYIGGTIHNIKLKEKTPKQRKREQRTNNKFIGSNRLSHSKSITIMQHTDNDIEHFKKQLAANKAKIQSLQDIHKKAHKDSFQYFNSVEKIRQLNHENMSLEAKIRSVMITTYDRYKSHYHNHRVVS